MNLFDQQMRGVGLHAGFGNAGFESSNLRQGTVIANLISAQQSALYREQPRITILTFKDEMQADIDEYLKDWKL